LILDKSSFYAKAGGQESNLGTNAFEGGGELVVSNVQTYGGYALYSGVISGGGIRPKTRKVLYLRAGPPSWNPLLPTTCPRWTRRRARSARNWIPTSSPLL
jgi:hypothetical protein